jgi:hypothetical protein
MGKPPNPLISGMPEDCRSGSAPPPAPTTNNSKDETFAGGVHSQLPTVEKVNTVSVPSVVDVGTHAAAFAGEGIETNKPEIRAMTNADIAFGRALIFFWRCRKGFTDTSLLRANKRETPR